MSAFGDAVKAARPVFAFFAEVQTSPPTLGWSGMFPITIEGKTYQPVKAFGAIGSSRQTTRAEASEFRIGLQISRKSVEQTYAEFVAAMQADAEIEYRDAVVTISIGVFDLVTGQLAGGLRFWAGGLGSHLESGQDGPAFTSTLQVETVWAKAMQAKALHLSDEDQQRLFPGDLFLEFLAELQDGQRITWDPVL